MRRLRDVSLVEWLCLVALVAIAVYALATGRVLVFVPRVRR